MFIFFSVLLLLAPTLVQGHEIRPGYLEISEAKDGQVKILWKQPILGEVAIPLKPRLSSGWLEQNSSLDSAAEAYLLRQWVIPGSGTPLQGQTVTIEGLKTTMTDVLLRVTFADGHSFTRVIRPLEASFTISRETKETVDRLGYFRLGLEHIFLGLDHLLFVFGLLLLVPSSWMLLKTITAFTVAHSLTLALAIFGWVRVPVAPVETVIALSIIFLASEIVKQQRGVDTLTARAPWLVAFSFGLLHGFGFASALTQIGIPASDIPLCLFLFNCGVEAGQLAFVGVVYLLAIVPLLKVKWQWPVFVRRLAPYAMGSVASYWFLQRFSQLF